METEMSYLLDILQKDVEFNGNQPMTTMLLISLINKAQDKMEEDQEELDNAFDPHWD